MKNSATAYYHAIYEHLPEKMESAVDGAYNAVVKAFHDHGFETRYDDGAEELVAAITRYLVQSNPESNY